jgi:hypothetical protein
MHFLTLKAEEEARCRMVDNVMPAVMAGEHDEARLVDVAIAVIEGYEGSRPSRMARQ